MVVFDTNVLVSAFQFGGSPAQLLDMARAGKLNAATSPSILNELTRILGEKFGWPENDLQKAVGIIKRCMTLVEPTIKLNVVKDDPKDDHIIECAVAAGADAIITGDKDLLRMREFQEIKMMQVAEFLSQQIGR